MTDYPEIAAQLEKLLGLTSPPVALAFSKEPPPFVPHVAVAAPAGCAYWKRAAAGEVFYTVAADHHGCAVGAYTHGAEMGDAQKAELTQLIGVMAGLEYLSPDEVPSIPARKEPLGVLTYAPLSLTLSAPDVVLVRVRAKSAMLVAEAVHAAGKDGGAPVMRPACAMIPAVQSSGRAATSFGCIGNRTYTGLGDDEVWYAIPGDALDKVMERLSVVAHANRELAAFHGARLAQRA